MDPKAPTIAYLDKLIAEGENLLANKFQVATSSFTHEDYVPVDPFQRWRGNCRVLETKLGGAISPWKGILLGDGPNKTTVVMSLLGTVRSIKDAVDGGHLATFTDLVIAESFSNLLDQADYLHAKGYWLAAGVLGRAVLEEDLRRLSQKADCFPEKERPTLNDLNTALYKAGRYDKLEFKLIDSLAAIGNDCAHNLPGATSERVKHFLEQLAALLSRLKT
ncbi:MAG TPA: hypothetical protein VGD97_06835 [Lacunisphaera sp.]